MIGYLTIGVNDLAAARAFYTELLAMMGAKPQVENDRMVLFGDGEGAGLAICTPYDGQPASGGNGTMVALQIASKELVHSIYQRALELGARCEGEPGQRVPDQFYGAYIRDVDGNKLAFYFPG